MEQVAEIEKLSKRPEIQNTHFKISIPRGSYIASGVTAFVGDLHIQEGLDITINETNTLRTISNVADRGYNMGIIRYQVSDEAKAFLVIRNGMMQQDTNFSKFLW